MKIFYSGVLVPKKWWPIFEGMIYEGDIQGLKSDTRYTYRVGGFDSSNSTQRLSNDFNFNSPPSRDPMRKTVVGVLADQGTFMLLGFAVTAKLVEIQDEKAVDYVMTVGDLSYAGLSSDVPLLNITSEDEFERVWDLWGVQSEPGS